jgi:DNA-binding transcriptional LysR family regulator
MSLLRCRRAPGRERQITFSDTQSMLASALAVHGLAYLPEDAVAEHVRSGRLELVLGDWSPPFDGYFLYYPRQRQSLPAFQIIVNALRHRQASS